MMQQGKANFSAENIEIWEGNYLDIHSQRGVKENTKRLYVKRAEVFVRAAQGRETT